LILKKIKIINKIKIKIKIKINSYLKNHYTKQALLAPALLFEKKKKNPI